MQNRCLCLFLSLYPSIFVSSSLFFLSLCLFMFFLLLRLFVLICFLCLCVFVSLIIVSWSLGLLVSCSPFLFSFYIFVYLSLLFIVFFLISFFVSLIICLFVYFSICLSLFFEILNPVIGQSGLVWLYCWYSCWSESKYSLILVWGQGGQGLKLKLCRYWSTVQMYRNIFGQCKLFYVWNKPNLSIE